MKSSKFLPITALSVLMFAAGGTAAPAMAGEVTDCMKGSPQTAIHNCTRIIDTGFAGGMRVSTKQALNTLSYGGKLTQGAHKVVFIPGMTIGLAPLPGFELGTNFSGFRHEDRGITISVLELPAQVFVHMKTGFAEGPEAVNEKFASRGIKVRTITPVTIDGAEGLIVASTQTLGGKKMKLWILVLGGKTATALVYVTAPVEQELSDARVTTMLDSIRFRDAPSLQTQIDILPYRFGNMAGFRVWRTMFGNMALLSTTPKGTPFSKDWPMIVVMRLKCVYPKDATPAQFAEQFFNEFKHATITKIHKTVELTVAGAEGYEMTATGINTKTKEPVKISLWFRYEAGHLLGVLAMVKPADHNMLHANLRKVAANLRNK